ACKYYCHFTSPIRRYPDLQIHRIIKDNIHGRLDDKRISHYEAILDKVADDNSKKERRAEEAEREVEKLKKVEYMSAHKGEIFEGIISGVTSRGIYVELPNTIEGFVNVSNMYDDYYCFSQDEYAMIGEVTGKKYSIGDKVKVKVKGTDKLTRTIDFCDLTHNNSDLSREMNVKKKLN
ncbi:MAG: S1 RNA-binding domain-containing protein, partial [Coprococcus sp.]